MNIGVCRVKIRLPENHTLKGKRQVVKSIVNRVKNTFNASIAEIEDHELWQLATIGISVVSNDSRHANEELSKIVDFISNGRFDIELLDYEIEIIPAL